MLNSGPHGLSEVLYAFTSAANNNGSAFAGLSANTDFYNAALAAAMFLGRFLPIVFVCSPSRAHWLDRRKFLRPPGRFRRTRHSLSACLLSSPWRSPDWCICLRSPLDRSRRIVMSASSLKAHASEAHAAQGREVGAGAFSAQSLVTGLPTALRKLDPRNMIRTPSCLSCLWDRSLRRFRRSSPQRLRLVGRHLVVVDRHLCEPRGRGRRRSREGSGGLAARAAKKDSMAKRLSVDGTVEEVRGVDLHVGDHVVCVAGDTIPGTATSSRVWRVLMSPRLRANLHLSFAKVVETVVQ